MVFPLPKRKQSRGQMLLGVLISIAIFAILVHALFTLIASSFDLVNFNRARITARHLAQERIELARNLPYNDLGTIGGIPSGILQQEESVVRNGLAYLVKTSVVYIDDPADGLAPDDPNPADYKRVRVEVSWEGLAASRKNPIILITNVSETLGGGTGGTLNILVFDANGQPVPQAEVRIVASTITPPVDLDLTTDNQGRLSLPGAEPCDTCYEITVTKESYSTDRTYGADEVTNPVKPHASLLEGEVTQVSFVIDLTGTINISSVDSRENNFDPLGNIPFRLRGNKIIGTDASGTFVYKYDVNHSTDSGGNLILTEMEWDTYRILMPSPTSWDISGSIPLQPLSLAPEANIEIAFALSPHSTHSLLVIAKDPSQDLIASASARLYDADSYDEVKTTGQEEDPDFGQVLFSNLEEKIYFIEATASGYLNFNGSFEVSGYTTGEIVMTPE